MLARRVHHKLGTIGRRYHVVSGAPGSGTSEFAPDCALLVAVCLMLRMPGMV